jgi:phosphomannomutase
MNNVIKFGTDGWRGVIADEFTFSNLRRVAAGTAEFLKQDKSKAAGPILIGYDRRFFSKEFAQCVGGILQRAGFTVLIAKAPMPTPAVSVSVVAHKSPWGFMITASHNPAQYNGFKIKEGSGRSAPPEVTAMIEKLLPSGEPTLDSPAVPADLRTFDYRKEYDAYVRRRIDWKAINKFTARIALDHLHGVAAGIPESLFRNSKLRVHSIHSEVDPLFGGLHPEPIDLNLGDLQKEIRRTRSIVGFAYDGDADRLGVMDENGRYLSPHQVFPLLMLYGIEKRGWKGKVVQSVSLGALGPRIAEHFGFPFEEVPVGFKHVAQRMINEDILAGGEESGGYAFKDGLPERDGILNSLLFLEMLAVERKTTSELVKAMEKRFGAARFKRYDIPLKQPIYDKAKFSKDITARLPNTVAGSSVAEVRTQDGVKIVLKDGAWVLMRPSGTEPLLRTYAETDRWNRTDELLNLAQQWVQAASR